MAEAISGSSLEAALRSNRNAQVEIIRYSQYLGKKKAENRRMASRVSAHLSTIWDRLEHPCTEPPRPDKRQKTRDKANEELRENQALKPSINQSKQNHLIRKWRYDPYRKWFRRFFVDPEGNAPLPNDDTRRRRAFEQGKPFYHSSRPWSTKELENLNAIVLEMRGRTDTRTAVSREEVLDRIDFERVAQSLNEQTGNDAHKRSPPECRVNYSQSINTSAFTEEESSRLSELVQLPSHRSSWCQIASALGTSRTPWQCFVAYQSKLARSRPTRWSPSEDDLLLKFSAAMGPQWVFHMGAASQMSRLFPDKSPKQILARAHASLVNPSYIRDVWSDEEERKLVLCMKVYRDDPSPLAKAAGHFPGRATKSVSEKWNRCLDPNLLSNPFTTEEDMSLIEAVKRSVGLEWTRIAHQFPGRHPRTLANRWTELASHGDFIEICAQHGVMDNAGTETVLARPDDFFIRAKPTTESLDKT